MEVDADSILEETCCGKSDGLLLEDLSDVHVGRLLEARIHKVEQQLLNCVAFTLG